MTGMIIRNLQDASYKRGSPAVTKGEELIVDPSQVDSEKRSYGGSLFLTMPEVKAQEGREEIYMF